MENLEVFQEIQNQNIEILKQQLQDMNVNSEEEIINKKYKKPRKSKKLYYRHHHLILIRKIKNLLRNLNVNGVKNKKRPF